MTAAPADARIARGMRAQLELRRRHIASGAAPIGWKVVFGAPGFVCAPAFRFSPSSLAFLTESTRARLSASG